MSTKKYENTKLAFNDFEEFDVDAVESTDEDYNNPKDVNRSKWTAKHSKDKDYKKKYEYDDDGWN